MASLSLMRFRNSASRFRYSFSTSKLGFAFSTRSVPTPRSRQPLSSIVNQKRVQECRRLTFQNGFVCLQLVWVHLFQLILTVVPKFIGGMRFFDCLCPFLFIQLMVVLFLGRWTGRSLGRLIFVVRFIVHLVQTQLVQTVLPVVQLAIVLGQFVLDFGAFLLQFGLHALADNQLYSHRREKMCKTDAA